MALIRSNKISAVTGGLLPDNGDYVMIKALAAIEVTLGTYDGTSPIGPASGSDWYATIVNVKNYNTATCTGSWALGSYGIKDGVATAITPTGQAADVSNYDYFVFTTANRQFNFS